ncbi:uncharacterized protein EI90DRAFT_3075617 [Cantharellus anzutake]|uniref:uncharacterized protein n=1 Tax=Cantharellus anzutake TaxID=1750568 RepID=UPI001906766B|nr:uncharacterized protein EI90DRAFT_3075617 [Cantharellus anzutake]KAF8324267.1 hypothetical protein EI90DRAFT_3075617 [Cantharellus anzutake]
MAMHYLFILVLLPGLSLQHKHFFEALESSTVPVPAKMGAYIVHLVPSPYIHVLISESSGQVSSDTPELSDRARLDGSILCSHLEIKQVSPSASPLRVTELHRVEEGDSVLEPD